MDWRNSGCTGFSLMEVIKIKVLPNERSDREVQRYLKVIKESLNVTDS